MTLDEIAIQYGADKNSNKHGYTRWYERYFRPFVGTPVTILEIGICTGCSLRMWRDYFGPDAQVIGLDYEAGYCRDAAADGFRVYHGSQDDTALLSTVMSETNPMLIVDDGGHNGAQQLVSFKHLFPLLQQGGVYVIEDLHAAFWGWGGHDLIPYLHELSDGALNRGKSELGNIAIDAGNPAAQMSEIDRNLSGVHFHPSIVFMEKGAKG